MSYLNEVAYTETLLRFMELKLPLEEGMKVAERIKELGDLKLAKDYLFLLGHYAEERVEEEVVEEIREVIGEHDLHPSKDLLFSFVTGGLDGKSVKGYIEKYLETCESCREYVSELKESPSIETVKKLIATLEGHVSASLTERLRKRISGKA